MMQQNKTKRNQPINHRIKTSTKVKPQRPNQNLLDIINHSLTGVFFYIAQNMYHLINRHTIVMKGIIGLAILFAFQIGVSGWVSGPSFPGGWTRVKPWYWDVQQAGQFAVNSIHPYCQLISIYEAHKQVKAKISHFFQATDANSCTCTGLYLLHNNCHSNKSRRMGKPTLSIGENKGTDQLRSNGEADQRHCFRYTNSTNSCTF